MVEATLCMGPQPFEGSCTIAVIRRSVCLEGIDPDFRRCMQVPARFCIKGRNMTACAHRFPFKEFISSCGCGWIKTALGRQRSQQRYLVRMQCRQFGCDQIFVFGPLYVTKAVRSCNWEL